MQAKRIKIFLTRKNFPNHEDLLCSRRGLKIEFIKVISFIRHKQKKKKEYIYEYVLCFNFLSRYFEERKKKNIETEDEGKSMRNDSLVLLPG